MVFSCIGFAFADSLADTEDQIFASIQFNDGIAYSYPDKGAVLFEKNGKVSVLVKDLDYPTGLAVDNAGNLYFSETGTSKIYKIDEATLKMTEYVSGLTEPMGLSYNAGKLYIAETGKNRIDSYDGKNLVVIAGIEYESETEGQYDGDYVDGRVAVAEFDHPQGVFVMDGGTIYVSDTNNHAIRKIQNGRVYSVWNNRELSDNLSKPGDLWVTDSTLYVRDLYLGETLSMQLVENKFTDVVKKDWFYSYVVEAADRKLVKGMTLTTFAPEGSLTRAQFVQMLANTYLISNGNAVINGDSRFTDVVEKDWYFKTLAWAGDMNIITAGTAFRPEEKITRQDMFTMLYKYAGAVGEDTSARANLSAFSDANKISASCLEAFQWTVANKIVEGHTGLLGKILAPLDGATRAQAVKILITYMK